MQTTQNKEKNSKQRSELLKWGLGYVVVLLSAVGLIYYWRVNYLNLRGFSPLTATLLAAGLFSLLYLIVFLAARLQRGGLPLKAAILIFAAGLLFAFANPPLQAPDESMHFLRAWAMSEGHFEYNQQQQYPRDVNLLLEKFSAFYNWYHPTTKINPDQSMADAFNSYSRELHSTREPENAATLIQQTTPYVATALGMALGRLLGGDALICLYFGRVFNVMVYALLCYFALRAASRFRALLAALMLVPVSLFIASSTSADSLLLGMTWLFVGYCLAAPTDKKKRREKAVALAVSFAVLFAAKYSFLALLPLLFFIDTSNNAGEGKSAKREGVRLLLVCLAAGVGLFAVQYWHTIYFNNFGKLDYYDPAVNPMAQLRFVFSYPLRYAMVFLNSLYQNSFHLLNGGIFGWLDVKIPFVSFATPFVLLLAALMHLRDALALTKRQQLLFALTGALGYAFVYTGMYLTCTHYTSLDINGVQMRYLLFVFLPLFALMASLFGRLLPPLADTAQATPTHRLRALAIPWGFAVISAALLFQAYFLGV